MKRLLTLFLLIITMLPAFSQRIVVEKNDNAIQAIDLQNFRRITFSGDIVNIMQNNGSETNWEMNNIARIYFDNYTHINEMEFNEKKELVSYITSDRIAVNCKAGEEINIYNISGSIVQKEVQESDGGSISIANLPKGMYLLRANLQTVKIIKK